MHIHILGICGTFMAGIAILAKEQGHHVTGSDLNVYPPMSTQLIAQGIKLHAGYDIDQFSPTPDLIIVGNAMKRGNPAVEYMLNTNLPYISGPQWLAENILQNRWVLAVAGTHGKTTTTSMLAWILEYAGLKPGFLIGGIPHDFGISARLGDEPFFIIEADEYDTAYFDKRSKFIHYHPRTAILNNLEFDHADIFPDLDAIKTQFHYFIRTIPGNGLIICPQQDENLNDVITRGCWTPVEYLNVTNGWESRAVKDDGSEFAIYNGNQFQGHLSWNLLGQHNVNNALAAIAAARHAGVKPEYAINALTHFKGVKRRLEIRDVVNGITIYDDFAHHPTAITTTLAGLRYRVGKARIIVVLECGSYTMRTGAHSQTLAPALDKADCVLLARPKIDWGIDNIIAQLKMPAVACGTVEEIIDNLLQQLKTGDHILIMSNTGFGEIHSKLIEALKTKL